MARKVSRKNALPMRARDVLQAEAVKVGCYLGSIGDYERLAGINTESETDRRELWWQFQPMFKGPTQPLFDAVVDHCAEIALTAIREGRLCLLGSAIARQSASN